MYKAFNIHDNLIESIADKPNGYIVDSGSSISIENDATKLMNILPCNKNIQGIGGDQLKVTGKGLINIGDKQIECVFVPRSIDKILSVGDLTKSGNFVCFFHEFMIIIPEERLRETQLLTWLKGAVSDLRGYMVKRILRVCIFSHRMERTT